MSCRILVADRSASALKAVELALPAPEFAVACFGDGLEAIRAIPDLEPDAVLTGFGLPSRDGYDVADFAKAPPRGRQVAVFFLRGAFEPLDPAKLAPIDHDGIIVKPFDGETVLTLVRAAIDRRKELPSIPEEPVLVKPEPASAVDAPVSAAGLESMVRDLVRREIGVTRADIEAQAREIVAAEFKKLLVEELKNIDTRKF
jgi:two-component system chemotaxis response regulator CheY